MAKIGLFKQYPGLSVLFTLEIVLFLIISYQIQVEPRVSLLEKIGLAVIAPVQSVNNRVFGGISHYWEKNKSMERLQEENKALKKELNRLRIKDNLFRETHLENQRLRGLLDIQEREGWQYVYARVVGRVNRRNDYMLLVDKGTRDGVQEDFGVFGVDGVVGIVWEVTPTHSKIMTAHNPGAVISALLQDTRYRDGYVRGRGRERETGFDLGVLENVQNSEPVEPGDLLLTSGLDGVFPKALKIGTVVDCRKGPHMFHEATVRLATDFRRIEEVTILVPNQRLNGRFLDQQEGASQTDEMKPTKPLDVEKKAAEGGDQ